MSEIIVKRTIPRPIAEVWPVLADFAGTSAWNPEVLASRSVNGLTTGLGAVRHCEFDPTGKKWTQEEIIEFSDDDHRYILRMIDGPAKPPIDDVTVEMSAAADGPAETIVTARAILMGRGLKQRLFARVGGVALKPVLSRVLAGLDQYLETRIDDGQPLTS